LGLSVVDDLSEASLDVVGVGEAESVLIRRLFESAVVEMFLGCGFFLERPLGDLA